MLLNKEKLKNTNIFQYKDKSSIILKTNFVPHLYPVLLLELVMEQELFIQQELIMEQELCIHQELIMELIMFLAQLMLQADKLSLILQEHHM